MSQKIPRLKISNDSVFYVVAPAKVATGGPEVLHQLVYHLRVDLGYEAYMYYLPSDSKDPVPLEYLSYGNPFIKNIIDQPKNILIVPEVIWGIEFLNSFTQIQKVVWWLSVDNFIISYVISSLFNIFPRKYSYIHIFRLINKITRWLLKKNAIDVSEIILKEFIRNKNAIERIFHNFAIKQADLHLCQSHYAMDFLASFSIENVAYLSDYLSKEFLFENVDINFKEDIVAFNSKKEGNFMRKIMKAASDVRFVPIENMTRREVIELLKKAKVYVDFGNHPGKDRMPREAAVLGCCVIVGKKGSAANDYDVPIPDKYKFKIEKNIIPSILNIIKDSFKNFEKVHQDFCNYRENIKKEPEIFLNDLKAIFGTERRSIEK